MVFFAGGTDTTQTSDKGPGLDSDQDVMFTRHTLYTAELPGHPCAMFLTQQV